MRLHRMASLDTKPVDPYGRKAEVDEQPRCWRCSRMLAVSVTKPWVILCPRCKAKNGA